MSAAACYVSEPAARTTGNATGRREGQACRSGISVQSRPNAKTCQGVAVMNGEGGTALCMALLRDLARIND